MIPCIWSSITETPFTEFKNFHSKNAQTASSAWLKSWRSLTSSSRNAQLVNVSWCDFIYRSALWTITWYEPNILLGCRWIWLMRWIPTVTCVVGWLVFLPTDYCNCIEYGQRLPLQLQEPDGFAQKGTNQKRGFGRTDLLTTYNIATILVKVWKSS